jgi:hypothetical protein
LEVERRTLRKYVSASKGDIDVLPTRIQITRTKELIVHDIGSIKQQQRMQFPQLHILVGDPGRRLLATRPQGDSGSCDKLLFFLVV